MHKASSFIIGQTVRKQTLSLIEEPNHLVLPSRPPPQQNSGIMRPRGNQPIPWCAKQANLRRECDAGHYVSMGKDTLQHHPCMRGELHHMK